MFYRDEHDEIERASMSSTVTGFNGVHILFKRTDTLSLDTALTLECGTGMWSGISLGDQIFCHDQTSSKSSPIVCVCARLSVCVCCPACFFHDIITQAFLITMAQKAFSALDLRGRSQHQSFPAFCNHQHKSSCVQQRHYDLSNRTVTANTNPCDKHRLKGWEHGSCKAPLIYSKQNLVWASSLFFFFLALSPHTFI